MSSFSSAQRPSVVERLRNTDYDVVVVGGGITGAGCALDAASRGLRVALVERHDLASGTSSKSSKLVHGGLRYLQQHDVRLVYEALAERQRLLANAPHLVRELDFCVPIVARRAAAMRKVLSTGLWAYDVTGGFRIGKVHRGVDTETALAHMPTLDPRHFDGAFFYPDAQTDDARLTMTIARTAAVRYGADVATYCAVEGFEKDASGAVGAVAVHDGLGGERFAVRARHVVCASGVWSDAVRAVDEGRDPAAMRPAKGIHLVVPRSVVANTKAFIVPVPRDRRSVFVLPWGGVAWIGTTDTDYDGRLDDPQATPADIRYCLDALNTWLREPIADTDVIATFAGLRPLLTDTRSARTADLSRRHTLIPGSPNVVTITGGKLTTYRRMAADAVDYAVDKAGLSAGRSVTRRLRLDGSAGFREWAADPAGTLSASWSDDPAAPVSGEVATSLLHRHGSHAEAVADLVRADPGLGRRLVPELPYLRAEVVWACRYEAAQTVADVLERRVRLAIEHRSRGGDAVEDVAAIMGAELGWDPARRAAEATVYRARVQATRDAEKVTSDAGGRSA
ncbi:MAG: glycerol-3-phosphate dehydrogenase/oxidase [Acidimicrobiia bacterium]